MTNPSLGAAPDGVGQTDVGDVGIALAVKSPRRAAGLCVERYRQTPREAAFQLERQGTVFPQQLRRYT